MPGAGNQVFGGAGGVGGVGGDAGADNSSNFPPVLGGKGGHGGAGASVYGGAISASDNVINVSLDGTAGANAFIDNGITSGSGGAGGAGGHNNRNSGTISNGGDGGIGGDAFGGGLSYHIPAGSSNTTTALRHGRCQFVHGQHHRGGGGRRRRGGVGDLYRHRSGRSRREPFAAAVLPWSMKWATQP